MPIRVYKCEKCQHQDDFFEKMDAPKERQCPKCKKTMKRQVAQIGEPNLVGPGFYQNDY